MSLLKRVSISISGNKGKHALFFLFCYVIKIVGDTTKLCYVWLYKKERC